LVTFLLGRNFKGLSIVEFILLEFLFSKICNAALFILYSVCLFYTVQYMRYFYLREINSVMSICQQCRVLYLRMQQIQWNITHSFKKLIFWFKLKISIFALNSYICFLNSKDIYYLLFIYLFVHNSYGLRFRMASSYILYFVFLFTFLF